MDMLSKNNIDLKKLLSELPLFFGLAPQHLIKLMRTSRSMALQKDRAIYRVGDSADSMYVLLSGQVKLTLSCNRGNEKVIDVIEAMSSFAEAELFGIRPYRVSAMTVMPSRILRISGGALKQVMTADSRIALRILEILANRQIALEAHVAATRYHSNDQRLLEYLLSLTGRSRNSVDETTVTLTIQKQLLASLLGMQPETLSRTLRDLSEFGLIVVTGRQIRLQNVRIAKYFAGEAPPLPIILPDRWRVSKTNTIGRAAIASGDVANAPMVIARPISDAINKAGRQRMLCQRMAKSWLMLEQGVSSRRARVILKHSVDLFDDQMEEFAVTANSPASRAASVELSNVWKPYRALLVSRPSRKGARLLFSMNEEVLHAANGLTMSFEDADGTHHGKLVNLAGRERMLSQQVAKFFLFRRMNIQVRKSRVALESANEEFTTTLGVLLSSIQDNPMITAELGRIAKRWHALQSPMAFSDTADLASTARGVCTISEHLLQRIEKVVEYYAGLPA